MKRVLMLAAYFLMFSGSVLHAASWPRHELIDKAKRQHEASYEYARKHGARVGLTKDQKSFYALWLPEGADMKKWPPMIVSLHGHGSFAFDDFRAWHPILKDSGYGLLALQWWKGGGERTQDYLRPQEIYKNLDEVLRHYHTQKGTMLLHGFSRGSANLYAVAALDRANERYFALFVANAGKADSGYPPTQEIERGVFGEKPFEGSHWITYAGALDENPDRDGVPAMQQTAEWLERKGAVIDLRLEDAEGDHGGFHRRPENARKAVEVFRQKIGG